MSAMRRPAKAAASTGHRERRGGGGTNAAGEAIGGATAVNGDTPACAERPQFEQNSEPAATGEPQFSQNCFAGASGAGAVHAGSAGAAVADESRCNAVWVAGETPASIDRPH